MQVINYFESNRQAHWLEEIKRSDWSAGAFLSDLIRKGAFFDAVGAESKVLLLTEGDELISYCTSLSHSPVTILRMLSQSAHL